MSSDRDATEQPPTTPGDDSTTDPALSDILRKVPAPAPPPEGAIPSPRLTQIVPNLYLGDLPTAQNVELLKTHKIYSVFTAMRGRVRINETFLRHQILLDDDEQSDILTHFLPSISFIQSELDKGRGVLVHCVAGMSRSVTIVAAYLMYTYKLRPGEAIEIIRHRREGAVEVAPNPGFLYQLEVFHAASFSPSRKSKAVRQFYTQRVMEDVMNGDGGPPETEMFASFPRTPADSVPPTPGGRATKGPRRRIRCKMCRQELAAREHMYDHGNIGPATPVGQTPAASRRPSTTGARGSLLSNMSMTAAGPSEQKANGSQPASRRSSMGGGRRGSQLQNMGFGMSSLDAEKAKEAVNGESALDTDEDDSSPERNLPADVKKAVRGMEDRGTALQDDSAARRLGRRMSEAMEGAAGSDEREKVTQITREQTDKDKSPPATPATLFSPSDLAARLNENPKLSALRQESFGGASSPGGRTSVSSPPILMNPKCSGYFVEPMKWMDHFLENGEIAGKITCPNPKCRAKLGNYDWAGVQCGCKEWVTPGFCINRSKVDEIVI
uniref:protein-tyrosine-phosphatase n=1 Tax=Schizophyllum commune (strain H4-8 / FGSC 9210) TaxID=578458 RepID=D8QE41_SCHCM